MAISVVQTVTKSGSTSPLNASFSSATRGGTCVLVAFGAGCSGFGPSVSGITIGGSSLTSLASSSGLAISEYTDVWIYALPNCPGGQTAISVTGTEWSQGGGYVALEVSGLALTTSTLLDKSSAGGSSGPATATDTGTTATTTNPSEFVLAASSAWSGQTGPASPWTNITISDTTVGYQIASSEATFDYQTTFGTSGPWCSAIVTLFPGANIFTQSVQVNQSVMRSAIW